MIDVLGVVDGTLKRRLGDASVSPPTPPISIPAILSSFDLNVSSEEIGLFSEALDVNSVEASWRLKRPTPVSLLPTTTNPNVDWVHLGEQEQPRVIVTISTNRCLAPLGSITDCLPFSIRQQDGYGGFAPTADFDIDKWCTPMEDAVREALKQGAHLVSFGEFDFPPTAVDGHSVEKANAYASRRREFIKRLYAALDMQSRPVVLFAGTCHDWTDERCRNLGYVLSSQPRGVDENDGPVIHEKQVSAKKMGENLKQVERASLPIYRTKLGERTKIGRLGILICIDAYDSTVTDAIFAQSSLSDEDRLGIILVPSYNPNARLYWSCQALSYRANCFVIYVNSLAQGGWSKPDPADEHADSEPWHRNAEIFCAGVPLETWRAQLQALDQLGQDNPRALANLTLIGLEAAQDKKTLIEVANGLKHEVIPSGPFTLHKWTIPNGCFQKLLEFAESRQPPTLRAIRRHVVTRDRFKQEAKLAQTPPAAGA